MLTAMQHLTAWWLLAASPALLVAAARHPSREHAASRELLRHLKETQAHNQTLSAADSVPTGPRLVACTLVKNELPYLVEWIEFHRLMGFSRIVIYDDHSDDNTIMLNDLYREHGLDYLRVEKGIEDESATMRQAHAAAHCHEHYSQEADWMINLDIDEYIWSPVHDHLPDFFSLEVPSSLHILYVGATRFGWGGQRRRNTYVLKPVSPPSTSEPTVQLLNPNGIQLVTQTHFKRAADKRFGEPEELIEDNWEYCRNLKGIWSPCTNDYDEKFGKTFVRAATATGVWTHGGAVNTSTRPAKLVNGNDMHSDLCPPGMCERADVNRLHIYHFRSPSMEDAAKKSKDWADLQSEIFTQDGYTDELYEQATFFFNQVRDISMARFGRQLTQRLSFLLNPPARA